MTRHNPVTCPNCTAHTAEHATTGLRAAAISLCDVGKADQDRKLAEARDTNPEIAALHRMLGIR